MHETRDVAQTIPRLQHRRRVIISGNRNVQLLTDAACWGHLVPEIEEQGMELTGMKAMISGLNLTMDVPTSILPSENTTVILSQASLKGGLKKPKYELSFEEDILDTVKAKAGKRELKLIRIQSLKAGDGEVTVAIPGTYTRYSTEQVIKVLKKVYKIILDRKEDDPASKPSESPDRIELGKRMPETPVFEYDDEPVAVEKDVPEELEVSANIYTESIPEPQDFYVPVYGLAFDAESLEQIPDNSFGNDAVAAELTHLESWAEIYRDRELLAALEKNSVSNIEKIREVYQIIFDRHEKLRKATKAIGSIHQRLDAQSRDVFKINQKIKAIENHPNLSIEGLSRKFQDIKDDLTTLETTFSNRINSLEEKSGINSKTKEIMEGLRKRILEVEVELSIMNNAADNIEAFVKIIEQKASEVRVAFSGLNKNKAGWELQKKF